MRDFIRKWAWSVAGRFALRLLNPGAIHAFTIFAEVCQEPMRPIVVPDG